MQYIVNQHQKDIDNINDKYSNKIDSLDNNIQSKDKEIDAKSKEINHLTQSHIEEISQLEQ